MNENTPEGLVMLTFVVRVVMPIHQPQMEALKPFTQFWYSYFLNMQYATKTRIKHTADFLLIRFFGTDPHEAPRLMLNQLIRSWTFNIEGCSLTRTMAPKPHIFRWSVQFTERLHHHVLISWSYWESCSAVAGDHWLLKQRNVLTSFMVSHRVCLVWWISLDRRWRSWTSDVWFVGKCGYGYPW